MTPDEAANYVEAPNGEHEFGFVTIPGEAGESVESSIDDLVADLTSCRRAMKALGIDDDRQDALVNLDPGSAQDIDLLRETLTQVAADKPSTDSLNKSD
ncbi:MAG: hypothetical protein ACYTDT_07085, partial [Planctomycetota bacterium]